MTSLLRAPFTAPFALLRAPAARHGCRELRAHGQLRQRTDRLRQRLQVAARAAAQSGERAERLDLGDHLAVEGVLAELSEVYLDDVRVTTVATDPKFVPLGAPAFLFQLDRPEANGLWVAQDTGGAILFEHAIDEIDQRDRRVGAQRFEGERH